LHFVVILALETVTRRGSVALMVDGVAHARSGPDEPTHGERLPAELFDWLAAHGRELDDVDRFAVVCGPGSFTGMRVGIAAMQGLALATGRPVAGIPTLDALLRAWWDTTPTHDGIVVPVLDGQRSDVFVDIVDAAGARSADQVIRLADSRVTTAGELAALLEPWKTRRITIVGDGAPKCTEILARTLPQLSIGTTAMPLAEAAARIVQAHPELAGAPHALRPVYLRRPDAVLARERAEARSAAGACTIRRAVIAEDLASVEGLQRQTFTNPWGAEAIRWELENTDVARLYVMHAPDGALVAYCACWIVFDELHINSLAVDVTRRRQGLARELLAFVLADAVRAGATSATLEVRASNIAARRLYEKLGFKVEGIRRDYYQDPREDAVILWARGLTGESTKYEVRSTK
jgi:tRNA threonylcarbamoyl adenosine modification protein YeaZ/ribosomal-protein-alanine acetyltransferase